MPALLATPLNPRVLKSAEKDGIVTEEVMFHSEKDGAKSVDIFALFSYPKGRSKLPAFVWNQGGLHQATTYWTEFGARRGYATLCIDFPLPGYRSTGGYPITSGLELGDDPRRRRSTTAPWRCSRPSRTWNRGRRWTGTASAWPAARGAASARR